jgi:hypothetical protein
MNRRGIGHISEGTAWHAVGIRFSDDFYVLRKGKKNTPRESNRTWKKTLKQEKDWLSGLFL